MKFKFRPGAAAMVAAEDVSTGLPSVVVVDDEPGNVSALTELLRGRCQVAAFVDPVAALTYLKANTVDVLLADQRMPQMLGTELLMHLKKQQACPVSVIVTGFTDVQDLVLCINEGLLHRYVLKPWAPADILGAVQTGVVLARRREALRRLVPHSAIQRVFPDGIEHLEVGRAVSLTCAVLFTDLRGYRAIADTLPTGLAYQVLIQYFERVTPVIARHGGFVDKFIGDGMLAIFDTPDRYAAQVIACAEEIVEVVSEFVCDIEGTVIGGPWRVGLGISGGPVTMGTIGSPERVEITVLGDTVNRAARLDEASKMLGAGTLVESHLIADPAPIRYRPLGALHLRNREGALQVGEIMPPDARGLAPAAALAPAIAAQTEGDLGRAMALLEEVAARWPVDQVIRRLPAFWRQPADEAGEKHTA